MTDSDRHFDIIAALVRTRLKDDTGKLVIICHWSFRPQVRLQPYAFNTARACRSPFRQSVAKHGRLEGPDRSGKFAGRLGIGSPTIKKPLRGFPFVMVAGIAIAFVGQPLGEQVLIGEIAGRRVDDAVGPYKAVRLPVKVAVDHPAQDRRPFAFELRFKLLVRRSGLACERNDVEASTRRIVDVPKLWLMVAGDHELECRPVGEEVAAHKAGGNGVTARKALDTAFGPCLAIIRLGSRHQTCAPEHGNLSRVPVAYRSGERVHWRSRGVVGHDADDGVHKHAFAVAAVAMHEHKRMFSDVAGEAVAAPLLQETNHSSIPTGRLAEEAQPQRAVGRR